MDKKFKINKRGDAQLALWLPKQIVIDIYNGLESYQKRIVDAGGMKPNFKEYFYDEFIKEKLKK